MTERQPKTKLELRLELKSIQEDLETEKYRLSRITASAEALGRAIQLPSRPASKTQGNPDE